MMDNANKTKPMQNNDTLPFADEKKDPQSLFEAEKNAALERDVGGVILDLYEAKPMN